EALSRGIPCLLLPSQNLSQVLALEKLDAGRAAFALDWRAIYGLNGLSAADERRSCRRIGDCIELFQEDPSARTRLVAHLRSRLSSEQLRRISGAQSRFFERYRDGSGPQDVASYIRHLVSPR